MVDVMLRKLVGNKTEKILGQIETLLPKNRIVPNILTFIGLGINIIGAYCYYRGYIFLGGITILFAGIFDILDGIVARARNLDSKIGAFIDSVVDRYSDFIILGGILTFFVLRGDNDSALLVLLVLSGSFLTSYIRAKSELIISKCDTGLIQRPERIIILALGSLLNYLNEALWFLAVSTHLTAFYRIYYTWKRYKSSGKSI